MAPILSFTAEEAWADIGDASDDSIFFHLWHDFPSNTDSEFVRAWEDVRNVRELVNKAIEVKRSEGAVGSSLQAEVDIYAFGSIYDSLVRLGNDLRFVLITSRATVHHREDAGVGIEVTPSVHAKCERCWHYRADVGADAAHPQICGRCVSNLYGAGEPRSHA